METNEASGNATAALYYWHLFLRLDCAESFKTFKMGPLTPMQENVFMYLSLALCVSECYIPIPSFDAIFLANTRLLM